MYKYINSDYVEYISKLDELSINLILCKPYHKIKSRSIMDYIDYNLLFKELNRVLKDNGYLFLFNPFSDYLINTLKYFDPYFEYIIIKKEDNNKLVSKLRPIKVHDIILVLIKKNLSQRTVKRTFNKDDHKSIHTVIYDNKNNTCNSYLNSNRSKIIEEIIKIHTKEEDTILDVFSNDSISLIKAYELNRNCISIENNKNKYDNAIKNIINRSILIDKD